MQHAASYQDLHDWEAERASIRETVVASRTDEWARALSNDHAAMAEAWDDLEGQYLTGNEVALFLRDNDAAGLFKAVKQLVALGVLTIAERRADAELPQ